MPMIVRTPKIGSNQRPPMRPLANSFFQNGRTTAETPTRIHTMAQIVTTLRSCPMYVVYMAMYARMTDITNVNPTAFSGTCSRSFTSAKTVGSTRSKENANTYLEMQIARPAAHQKLNNRKPISTKLERYGLLRTAGMKTGDHGETPKESLPAPNNPNTA